MNGKTSHNRRYLIGGAGLIAVALAAYGLGTFLPAYGPIAGTIAPQRYVDTLTDGEIPQRGRYVLVDAASARLYMIEDGQVRDSMKVIVGKPETPTPALNSVIQYGTINPYWHVTPDLVRAIIAPRVLKDGFGYLKERGYDVVTKFGPDGRIIPAESIDWKAVASGAAQVYVRQRPGPANSLGQFKFDLPNSDGIYLHDTPKKELFAQDDRNLSHGCVRLEDAPRLARWLLGQEPVMASAAPEQHVPVLTGGVPITIAYLDSQSQMRMAGLQ
jgi:murein L,D-transpeptidase YcbB/YkuD